MEKRAKGCEEKFNKLKDVYQKLRDEHITLLRQKAEVDKKVLVANAALEQSNKIHLELQESLEQANMNVKEIGTEFDSYKSTQGDAIKLLSTKNEELQKKNQDLKVIVYFT